MGWPCVILLIGAGGVFGSRIAHQQAGDGRLELTLGGRRLAGLQALRELPPDPLIQRAVLDGCAITTQLESITT